MKLKFKKQEFQDNAVMSVVDLFKGCASAPSTFSVEKLDIIDMTQDELLGYANNLDLSMEQIQENLREVQDRNLLPLTDLKELRFNIEMETGTGKTFVYTKTILELHKQYGFNKFVVVVPSVAIREGVYKSLQTTREYFKQEYEGVCVKPFIYNSAKRHEVRDFALSNNLEVMIVNIDAFKKNENLFNQVTDTMPKSAKEFLRETNPIIIIDEPQSVDNTAKAREAIAGLNPLFELRYSATHKQKINTVYRLTPVDAYNMHIVKQICVVNNEMFDDFNKPYIKLLSVSGENGYTAKLELDCAGTNGVVKRKTVTVKPNSNLETITGRDIYSGYIVAGINAMEGFEEIEFTNTEFLSLGKAIGDIDEMTKKREQIKRTIEAHLDKERLYIKRGIKVLSLFFIDEVSKYRLYDDNGTQKGIYAQIFEECYNELINQPRYAEVKDFFKKEAEEVHDGYFSKDKKGKIKNTNGETADDYSTYNTIMKDKEWLLSFDCPLRFIFSHSALKEGWDNPNVFQICTLIENKSTFTCRQKIGRGLRLCVDQTGERVDEKGINILHVIAEESFAEFADTLQKEIEEETGVKFGILDIDMFVNIAYTDEQGEEKQTSATDARDILDFFRTKNYVDNKGKMKDTLKNDLLSGKVELPQKFERAKDRIIKQIEGANKKVVVMPAFKKVVVKRKDEVFENDEFIMLWNKIKQKTIYRINMSKDKLIEKCVNAINNMNEIGKTKIAKETAKINIQKSGVDYTTQGKRFEDMDTEILIPDVVSILARNCKLTRDTIGQILLKSNRLQDFVNNPQRFIEEVTQLINNVRANECIDGITYTKLQGKSYSFTELFDLENTSEVFAFLDKTAVEVSKSTHDHIIYDNSTIERDFALELDKDEEVKLFFKIPDKFKIPTPIGTYNPDWAVYIETDNEKKLYFVIETKGSTNYMDLRDKESIKIECGKKHFEALGLDIKFGVAKSYEKFKADNV
ncbi:MAG: DEAD/DEAH box helicase family protein [Treponema sp.]|nr:DEAD/DEAH box helicase family protein [Treponema sp.]